MTRRIARWALAAIVAATLAPASAFAHATIVSTTPEDTSVVKTAPRAVSLKWSEAVDLGEHAVKLLDAAGKEIKTAQARHGPGGASTAMLELPAGLKNGTYVVSWRVVSSDSHPVTGAFSFSIGSPSAVLFAADGSSSAVVRFFDAFGRGVAFLGLALAVGGGFLLLVLWPEGPASVRGRQVLWAGVGGLLAGSAVVLLLQGPYAAGGSLSGVFDPSLWSFSLSTRFGHALVVRIVLGVIFAVLVTLALRRRRDSAVLAGLAVCAVGLVLTWTLTDHSRTGVQTWLGVPAGSVHLLAMALWFGGILMLLACVTDTSLAAVVPRFSRLALPCFAVLGASGLYLAWRQVGTFPALPKTDFGKLLLLKSGIVAAIVGLAYLSRRAVARGGGVRGSVTGEAFLGVAALGVTATLVNTAPARVSYSDPVKTAVAGPAGTRVELSVNPAKQGPNVVDVYLVKRDGMLLVVPELTAKLIPPGSSGALNVPLGSAEPGHYVASRMSVPYPGKWKLRLQIRTSEIDERDVDIPVRVR
jgi:copper transport protein